MAARYTARMRRVKTWLMDYAYLVTLGAVIAVVAASAIYTQKLREEQAADIAAAAQAAELRTAMPEATASLQPDVTPLPTIAPLEVRYTQLRGSAGTVWPLGGAVIRAYDAQEPVFWGTLGSYRTHAALDIAGEAGEDVLCASDGVVAGASRDALWGWRVKVDQTDGRQAVYAGLESADVAGGQSVTRGQRIGVLLAQIPCEAELGPHLHLALYRDGKPQDPEGMMPER